MIDYASMSFSYRTVLMNPDIFREKVKAIEGEREFLVELLNKPDLGILSIDVKQAIEELDELIDEFKLTFPEKI